METEGQRGFPSRATLIGWLGFAVKLNLAVFALLGISRSEGLFVGLFTVAVMGILFVAPMALLIRLVCARERKRQSSETVPRELWYRGPRD